MKKIVIIAFLLGLVNLQGQALKDYLRIAAENNPGLQAEYKEFEAALEKVPQARGIPDPTLSVSAFGQMVETRVGPQMARFSLSQMFPWFGTLGARADMASLTAESKFQSYLNARNKLWYEVSEAYYALYEVEGRSKIEAENIDLLESYKTISNSKFRFGNGTLVDVLRVDIMLKESRTNLEILRKKEVPLRARFNQLLNRDVGTPVVISETIERDPLPDLSGDRVVGNDHPLILSADLRVKASEAAEKVAELNGLPDLGIGLDYIMVGERTDLPAGSPSTPPDNGKDAIMPMVSVSLPIFRGKYRAAIRETQKIRESMELQKAEVANALTSSFEMTYFELQQQKEMMDLFAQQIQESEQVLHLLFTSYGNSGANFEEVLRMQRELLNYEKLNISALVEYQTAMAKLKYITANF